MEKLDVILEVETTVLADWLQAQGDDTWWNIDGDEELSEVLRLPCTADELASELRKVRRKTIWILGNPGKWSKLQEGPEVFDQVAEDEGGARVLYLTWGDPAAVWVLAEDIGVKQALDTPART